MRREDEQRYREFVVARLDRLRHAAYLLCRDWHTADDLVSIALSSQDRERHCADRHDSHPAAQVSASQRPSPSVAPFTPQASPVRPVDY